MKKENTNVILAMILLVFSAINIFLYAIDYLFQPVNYGLFLLFCIAGAVTATVFSLRNRAGNSKLSAVFGALMPLFALVFVISSGFVLDFNPEYIEPHNFCYVVISSVFMICALIIFFSSVKKKGIRIAAGILTAVLSVPCVFFLYIMLLFSNFGSNTILQTVTSPDEAYCAWAVSSDQGALGGDTCLYVRNIKKDVFIGIGTFKAEEKRLRYGRFGEEYDLVWIDENTLSVDNVQYNIPYILKTGYIDKYRYSSKMQIYIPDRKPDELKDTHDGFLGDGECIMQYHLTGSEIEKIETDIKNNGNWKRIDEESYSYLYGDVNSEYNDDGYTHSEIPALENGYYCFYNERAMNFKIPGPNTYSPNYIIVQYSPDDKILYLYEFDT
ncbi:hypothetical protein [Acetivibrio sp. MSJd-27]|uniref:hypothetical protein n=1 Tax=Acetivibrio sp. MSJd-27 TaxID=2841523 RepID=UPI001C1195F8|nr:hypothetical protein [Acetivibrio sp. MSJd-27]MBU5449279.1 hypothetical protein [Acetivibrio sp. MSJd-27]